MPQYIKERKKRRKEYRKNNPDWRLRKTAKPVNTYNKLPLHVSPTPLQICSTDLINIKTPWKPFSIPITPLDTTTLQQFKKHKTSPIIQTQSKKQNKNTQDKNINNNNNNYINNNLSDNEGETNENDFIVHFE